MKVTSPKIFIELVVLYVLLPCMLLLPVHGILKGSILLIGVIYVIYVSRSQKLIRKRELYQWKNTSYWRPILFRFLGLALLTIIFMCVFDKENLFIIVRKRPTLWLLIVVFYSVFSVYPQEFLYRTFFLQDMIHWFPIGIH